jgi:hypothetical protein
MRQVVRSPACRKALSVNLALREPSPKRATAVMAHATRKSPSSLSAGPTSIGTTANPMIGTMPKSAKEANMMAASRTLAECSSASGVPSESSSFIIRSRKSGLYRANVSMTVVASVRLMPRFSYSWHDTDGFCHGHQRHRESVSAGAHGHDDARSIPNTRLDHLGFFALGV